MMKNLIFFVFYTFILIFSPLSLYSLTLDQGHLLMDYPQNWKCGVSAPDSRNTICHEKSDGKKSKAFVFIISKDITPGQKKDLLLENLKKQLKAGGLINHKLPQNITKTLTPQVITSDYRILKKRQWIDSLHQDSEIPQYYTRYLITVTDDAEVAITFSAHRNHYKKYISLFEKMIKSLEVRNRFIAPNQKGSKSYLKGKDNNNFLTNGHLIDEDEKVDYSVNRQKKKKENSLSKKIPWKILIVLLFSGALITSMIRGIKKKEKAIPKEEPNDTQND